MSIINEALKKTQEKLRITTASPLLESQKSDQKEGKKIWIRITVIFVLVGFLGCGLIFFALSKNRLALATKETKHEITQEQTPQSFKPSPVPVVQNPHPSAQPPPAASKPNSNELVLSGIMTMGDEQLALINNKIYKVGDYIGDRQVLSISVDKVEISDNGKTLTLTTK